ncbi:MAG TPA: glycosyltransferase family 2 protein [Silvibacterium sp.]|nr:glycosyltransferase family 2 protein [Silvibacterium sp.]
MTILDSSIDSSADIFDVSFVIVSFNTREVLRECLESVERELAGLRVELLVVDNHSSDGSPEMIEREFPQVRLFRSDVNLGFASANNAALEVARGRYLVLLNSDAFLRSRALTLAVQHMDENPSVGLAGARLVGRDDAWQPSARRFPSMLSDFLVMTGLAAKFPRSRFFGSFDRTWADPLIPAETDWVPGAFSIIRPDALKKAGLFDPDFFLYSEEVDLCRRIRDAGYKIWYWPDIVVTHIGGESSRQVKSLEMSTAGSQLVLWSMRSMLIYYRKHHGSAAWRAKMLRIALCQFIGLRNRFSRDPRRQTRAAEYRKHIELIKQAWKDTHGGRVSPPRPW